MFGVSGLVDSNHAMWCSKPSKEANRLNPLIIANENLADLYKRNEPYYVLYNDLTVRPDGIRFPDQGLPDLVQL